MTTIQDDAPSAGFRITPDDGAVVNCDLDGFSLDGAPEWLSRRFTRERMQAVCEKVSADSGRAFLNQLLDNVPVALFVLLPLMALVLKMLFPLSKRYYAEHLLFVLHFHAFFFLILTIQVLVSRLASRLPIPEAAANLTILLISLYIPLYLYKAMRRVYEQGRLITLLKYVLLVFAYVLRICIHFADGRILYGIFNLERQRGSTYRSSKSDKETCKRWSFIPGPGFDCSLQRRDASRQIPGTHRVRQQNRLPPRCGVLTRRHRDGSFTRACRRQGLFCRTSAGRGRCQPGQGRIRRNRHGRRSGGPGGGTCWTSSHPGEYRPS
jgi:hypothetical protein